ncbi:MAG: ABC transporter permease [Ktedonobacteraceae bacterium]|nr:ABC transporter permease [Ktedonobacteraceae bacterium]
MLEIFWRVFTSSDLWAATLQFAALLLLPALGGVLSERSGVTNIGLEGMMLMGAFAGVVGALGTHSVLLGVLIAILAGALISLIHAVVSINFKANQVVSGIAINIAALGLTNYIMFIITGGQGVPSLPNELRLPEVSLGPLSTIPFLGPVLFQQNIIFYIALVLLIGTQFLLFNTNIGLRIRAVGEHPQAADTAGINVPLVRYLCVLGSGALAGLAGAFLSLGIAGIFGSNMTAGAGFIALAAVIFGKYTPWGAAVACLIFGLGQALGTRLQETHISPNLLNTLPYLLTLIALVGLVGRTVAPAADGVPYEPGTE